VVQQSASGTCGNRVDGRLFDRWRVVSPLAGCFGGCRVASPLAGYNGPVVQQSASGTCGNRVDGRLFDR
jgi:hypothetical protein